MTSHAQLLRLVSLGCLLLPALAGCNCWTCDGRPAGYAASCIGRSRGCDVGDPHGGCYGQQSAEPWHSGVCHCRTGQFQYPEVYSIHGTVKGLRPGHVVKIACSSPKVLGARFGNSAIMSADVSWDGRFSFPYKLAQGQTYDIFVLNHPAGQKCSVTRSSSGSIHANVVDVSVSCRNNGSGAAAPRQAPQASSQSSLPASMQQSLRATSKLHLKPGECPRYDEVASLPIRKSPVPCKRSFDLVAAHRDFQTEVKGHACASFAVKASAPVNVCFVPRHVWDSLGRAAVMADRHLCRCKGKTHCCSSEQKMWAKGKPQEAYVLYVAPAANEQQGSVHISVSIGKCGGINMKVAIGAAGVGLLGLIAMSDKKGKGGRGVGGHRSRLAMHNRL